MKAYKLTDKNHQTKNQTQWGPGVTHETDGSGELCGPGWLHYYDCPLLAVLMNPIHSNFSEPVLWEGRAEGKTKSDSGSKYGCTKLTTVKQIPLPVVTKEQRVKFSILCALETYKDPGFAKWAEDWLSGKDRSAAWSAWSAESAAWSAARSARSAAWSACSAARSKRFSLKRLAKLAMKP